MDTPAKRAATACALWIALTGACAAPVLIFTMLGGSTASVPVPGYRGAPSPAAVSPSSSRAPHPGRTGIPAATAPGASQSPAGGSAPRPAPSPAAGTPGQAQRPEPTPPSRQAPPPGPPASTPPPQTPTPSPTVTSSQCAVGLNILGVTVCVPDRIGG